jgi:large subunit ribosomal protein L20
MVRVKRGNIARRRRNNILDLTQGFKGKHSKLFRVANQQHLKAAKYSYKGRKLKKISFRGLWVTRINSSAKVFLKTKYSRLISFIKKYGFGLNRKILSQCSSLDSFSFKNTFRAIL